MGHKTECQQLRVVTESSDSGIVDNGVSLTQKHKGLAKLHKPFLALELLSTSTDVNLFWFLQLRVRVYGKNLY